MKRILTNLLLASVVILSSCSKEDDLLTPIPNPPNTNQSTDTNSTNVTGNDTTTTTSLDTEHLSDESLSNSTVLNLEGSRYNVTYSSFYLRNRFPICAIPNDTTIFEENINSGVEEVYFSNNGDGYLRTKTYPLDYTEPFYNVYIVGYPYYFEQSMTGYELQNNKIIVDVQQVSNNGNTFKYKITFDIIESTDTKLVIENTGRWLEEPNPSIGYLGVDCIRTVRLELQKTN
tara:strand:- start:738 stop:1430 length:693 start_codon:yes stop_codon:yes gene_type:complete